MYKEWCIMSKEIVRRWFFFKRTQLHYHQSFNTDDVYDKICQLHLSGHFSIMVLNNHCKRDSLNPEEWRAYINGTIIWADAPFMSWMTPSQLADELENTYELDNNKALEVLKSLQGKSKFGKSELSEPKW